MELVRKYIVIVCTWLCIFFYPTFQFLLIVGFFVVADTITGSLVAARKGEFVSKKFRKVIPKYIVFAVGVLTAYMIQFCFLPEFPAMKMIAGLIAWGELVSIDENIHALTGRSLFKFFIAKLQHNGK